MSTQNSRYSRYFTYIKPLGKIPIIKTYGSTIFTILVTAIFLLFAIKPTVETILVLQTKLTEYKKIRDQVDQKATTLSAGRDNFEALSETVKDKILTAVPDDPRIKTIIDEIDSISSRHNASVSAIQFQPITLSKRDTAQIGKIEELTFNANFESSYEEVKNLLQDLRASSRLISIESVTINRSSGGDDLVISISAKGYYLK